MPPSQINNATGFTRTISITPGQTYSNVFLHTQNQNNGAWSGAVKYLPAFSCSPTTFLLSVTKAGTGTGTVTSSPLGISCGADCSETYNYNTSVTLTATPSTGSKFTGWSGICTGTGTCTTTMTQARSVTATFALMTGTLTPATSACTIATGASSCNTTLTWTTTNPVGTSAITAAEMTSVSGISGSQAFAVPYSSRIFYLYNSSVLLATSSATATCAVNTTWNGSICASPTGTLTATPTTCKIIAGASSCVSNISWTTTNPIGTSAVTTPVGITVGTANTNTTGVNYTIGYGNRTFYLYNNNVELDTEIVNAVCTDTPIQTFWDGSKCVTPAGTLSSGGCSITVGNNSCSNAVLDWSVTNKIGNSRVDASYGVSPVVPSTTAVSGNTTFSLT